MPGRSETSRTSQTLVALASLVVIVAGMRAASDLLVPFLLAAFLAVISLPPLVWLKKRGTPNWLSMLLVASTFVLVSILVAVLVRNSATGLASKLGDYQKEIHKQVEWIKSIDLKEWFDSLNQDDPDRDQKLGKEPAETDGGAKEISAKDDETSAPESTEPDAKSEEESKGFDFFNTENMFRVFTGTLNSMTGLLSNAFLILLTVIFILLEAATIPAKLNAMPGGSTFSVDNMAKIIDKGTRFVAIKIMAFLAAGVLVGIMLAVIGVPFATFWALLAFFLNFIPNIGSILAAIPAIVVALLEKDLGTGSALWAAGGYVAINVLIGNVVEPRVMGKGLGLSTLVVFMSLIFWGWVLGPVGMLLSVPLTMTVKIALEGNPETRWIAVLLGPGPPTEKGQAKAKRKPKGKNPA